MTDATETVHRILVVDDEEDQRETLRMILELRGYTVDTAENGQLALENLRRGHMPCLVLLDLMMPVMDGWRFWAELCKDKLLQTVPVVVMSGVAQFPAARSIKAIAHLRKPVDLGRLFDVLEEYC